jgi:hypothetical protein
VNVQSATMREAGLHFLTVSRAYLRGEMASEAAQGIPHGISQEADGTETGGGVESCHAVGMGA